MNSGAPSGECVHNAQDERLGRRPVGCAISPCFPCLCLAWGLPPAACCPRSKWGALRASMGHPEPWVLNFMAIGNEVRSAGAVHCAVRCAL